jgi:hypothetical protein
MRTEYFVLPILVVVLGAVAVWALVLPTELSSPPPKARLRGCWRRASPS